MAALRAPVVDTHATQGNQRAEEDEAKGGEPLKGGREPVGDGNGFTAPCAAGTLLFLGGRQLSLRDTG
jgi:hypothetical protein